MCLSLSISHGESVVEFPAIFQQNLEVVDDDSKHIAELAASNATLRS